MMIGIVASVNIMKYVRISICIVKSKKDELQPERNLVNITNHL